MTEEEQKKAREAKEAEDRAKAERKAELDRAAVEGSEAARKALLAELGVTDPKEAKEALEAKKKAENERLSEAERTKKEHGELLSAKEKAEAKEKAAEARALAAEARAKKIESLSAAGVKPGELKVAIFLFDDAKAADAKLEEADFVKGLKKERPWLFADAPAQAAAGGQPAHTAPGHLPPPGTPAVPWANPWQPAPGATGGYGGQPPPAPASPYGSAGARASALEMTDEELKQYEMSMGIGGRGGMRRPPTPTSAS
jgi:hypothetical protein